MLLEADGSTAVWVEGCRSIVRARYLLGTSLQHRNRGSISSDVAFTGLASLEGWCIEADRGTAVRIEGIALAFFVDSKFIAKDNGELAILQVGDGSSLGSHITSVKADGSTAVGIEGIVLACCNIVLNSK